MFRLFRLAHSIIREKLKERRSPEWRHTRKIFLENHPTCAACAGKKHLQVHHVLPFHLHPELELSFGNLITLCMGKEECHFRLGHGGNWKASDPDVRLDAATYLTSPGARARIAADAEKKALSHL